MAESTREEIINIFDRIESGSRFFKKNLDSFEYFFFSITLLLLGKDLKGFVFWIIIGLSGFCFLAGFVLSRGLTHIKFAIEHRDNWFLIGSILSFFFIVFIFLFIFYSIIVSYRL